MCCIGDRTVKYLKVYFLEILLSVLPKNNKCRRDGNRKDLVVSDGGWRPRRGSRVGSCAVVLRAVWICHGCCRRDFCKWGLGFVRFGANCRPDARTGVHGVVVPSTQVFVGLRECVSCYGLDLAVRKPSRVRSNPLHAYYGAPNEWAVATHAFAIFLEAATPDVCASVGICDYLS